MSEVKTENKIKRTSVTKKVPRQPNYIWSGVVEIEWYNKPNQIVHLKCMISAESQDSRLPRLKVEGWPEILLMKLDKHKPPLARQPGGEGPKLNKFLTFHWEPNEHLNALTDLMSLGIVGYINFSRTPSLILHYLSKTKSFRGRIGGGLQKKQVTTDAAGETRQETPPRDPKMEMTLIPGQPMDPVRDEITDLDYDLASQNQSIRTSHQIWGPVRNTVMDSVGTGPNIGLCTKPSTEPNTGPGLGPGSKPSTSREPNIGPGMRNDVWSGTRQDNGPSTRAGSGPGLSTPEPLPETAVRTEQTQHLQTLPLEVEIIEDNNTIQPAETSSESFDNRGKKRTGSTECPSEEPPVQRRSEAQNCNKVHQPCAAVALYRKDELPVDGPLAQRIRIKLTELIGKEILNRSSGKGPQFENSELAREGFLVTPATPASSNWILNQNFGVIDGHAIISKKLETQVKVWIPEPESVPEMIVEFIREQNWDKPELKFENWSKLSQESSWDGSMLWFSVPTTLEATWGDSDEKQLYLASTKVSATIIRAYIREGTVPQGST